MIDIIFYDFEVFEFDWLVVLIDTDLEKETVIVNDKRKLENYYSKNKSNIWIGFNSRHYDQWILKAILAGFNPKEVNDWIIIKERPGWAFSDVLRAFPLNNYDVMNGIDRGLKTFEGFMGNDIRESSVDFRINRKLTDSEIEETIKYCRHDVEQTMEVFTRRISDFEAQISLLKMFKLPLSSISKTKVQLAAQILEASPRKYNDEFEISFPDTMRIEKYKEVVEWYKDENNRDYDKSLIVDVAGIPHVFAWGGVHGAKGEIKVSKKGKKSVKSTPYYGEGFYIMMDVASLYPSLMIIYNLLSRSCKPEKFKDIVDTRLKYKAASNPLQAPLKIVINGTYGAMKDKNNPLYDPLMANNVCVHGQLLLLDLIEHLEGHCEIIQSNTDGILVKLYKESDYDLIDDIAWEWEQRTGLKLEFSEYRKVFQKDVNNYVLVDPDGHYKSKGAYVKKLNDLDYDMAIVNKALVDFMTKGIPVEVTISKCNELKEFQQVKKISSKYKYIIHAKKILPEKTIRCFASKHEKDGGVKKLHAKTGTLAKIENTPEHCFLFNEEVNGWDCPPDLDKKWYINLAHKRLKDFGFN